MKATNECVDFDKDARMNVHTVCSMLNKYDLDAYQKSLLLGLRLTGSMSLLV